MTTPIKPVKCRDCGEKCSGKAVRCPSCHKQTYVLGDIHTNSVENFWSLLKRGILGVFHRVSGKHLQRYLDEFVFRFDGRSAEDQLLALVAQNAEGAHITFAELVNGG